MEKSLDRWLAAIAFCVFAFPAPAAIQILAVTSATDFQSGPISAGSLATLWCTGLTGIHGVVTGEGPVLPAQLAGVSVYAGGATYAPILAIADLGGYQQINIQIPWDQYGSNAVSVVQGQEKAIVSVFISAPWSVFFVNSAGYMVALHAAGYQLVTSDNPARPGEWIIGYGSNLGPVANTPTTGTVTPLTPLSPLAPVPPPSGGTTPDYSVVIPGQDRTVDYYSDAMESNFIGLAPLTVGVYQINFRIPDNPPSGDAVVCMRERADCGFITNCLNARTAGLTALVSTGAKLPIAP